MVREAASEVSELSTKALGFLAALFISAAAAIGAGLYNLGQGSGTIRNLEQMLNHHMEDVREELLQVRQSVITDVESRLSQTKLKAEYAWNELRNREEFPVRRGEALETAVGVLKEQCAQTQARTNAMIEELHRLSVALTRHIDTTTNRKSDHNG